MGTLRADTFELDRLTKQITLHGHVHMTINASGGTSSMKRALILAVLLAGGSAQAATALATTPPAVHHDANQPIAVSSDNFVAEKNPASAGGITGTYSGNVIITQGDIRMRSNSVRIVVVNNKPQKIFFNGNVVVNSASGTASGDAGVYDVAPQTRHAERSCRADERQERHARRSTHGESRHRTGPAWRRRKRHPWQGSGIVYASTPVGRQITWFILP